MACRWGGPGGIVCSCGIQAGRAICTTGVGADLAEQGFGRERMGKLLAIAGLIAGVATPALAQAAFPAGAVVQSVPASAKLDRALIRLAANPRDVSALLDAGNAALDLDDIDAATGFFRRAAELAPAESRAKAGLGAAMVRSENPYDALLMFEEAEKLGAPADLMAGDRGLAWDLVGNFTQAQALYRQVLARSPDDEVTRRLAISLGIGGNAAEARRILKPLVVRRDQAAMRADAFVLAISGDSDGAAEIAQATMARDSAVRIIPYLRYMPRLTAAQQAAAANFGHFPRTADIGQDDPRVAKYNRGTKSGKSADASVIPAGEPLGRKQGAREQRKKDRRAAVEPKTKARPVAAQKPAEPARPVAAAAAAPPPVPRPSVAIAPSAAVGSSPSPVSGQGALAKVAASQASAELPPVRTVAASPVAPPQSPPQAAPVPAPAAPAASTQIASFDLAAAEGSRVAAPVAAPSYAPSSAPAPDVPAAAPVSASPPPPPPPAVPAPVVAPEPPPPRSVADAFADFAMLPQAAATPRAGAVDITRIKPRIEEPPKPKPDPEPSAKGAKAAQSEKPAKPPKPVVPSRNWVQVGTGRDKAALAFDWRRLTKAHADLFKGRKGHTAPWGQTNRLVTGPFDSAQAAQQFVSTLKRSGIDSFTFTSAEGEEVVQLPAGK